MLTLNDCLLNTKKVFARQSDDVRNANIAILNYIKHLSETASVNIAAWDIETLFGDKSNKKASLELIKVRNEINKIFFGEVERTKTAPDSQLANVETILKNQLAASLKRRTDEKKRMLENTINTRIRDVDQYIIAMNDRIANIVNARKELAQLIGVGTEDKILSDIKELLLGNFYQFHDIEGSTINFITKNDIINKLIQPSAGLNITVNLGKFRIALDMDRMKINIFPFSNNVKVQRNGDNYFHPHVSSGTTVCWGNVSDQAGRMLGNMEVKNVMLLLATLLTTYNQDNPYAPLQSFKEVADDMERLKAMSTAQIANINSVTIGNSTINITRTNTNVPF
jgi:hypothetical protein